MEFENACFISYTHSADPKAQEIVNAFEKELSGQVSLYLPRLKVYLDTRRLEGGDFFDRELAQQLCRSVCMVLLFNPCYFDCDHPYCAREYKAMERLESERLPQHDGDLRTKGLIIPVVIRGEVDVPAEIRERRQCVSFEPSVLRAEDFQTRECLEEVHRVARTIYTRWRSLKRNESSLLNRCTDFDFPSEDEVRPWLEGIAGGRRPLPGR